jgi:hypothetical protein
VLEHKYCTKINQKKKKKKKSKGLQAAKKTGLDSAKESRTETTIRLSRLCKNEKMMRILHANTRWE